MFQRYLAATTTTTTTTTTIRYKMGEQIILLHIHKIIYVYSFYV
jgi:DNA-binding LytR/AlgR family response regulator